MFSHSSAIYVKKVSRKGYGVFASRFIAQDEEIERVPVLVVPDSCMWQPEGTSPLARYAFVWGEGTLAIPLGYGALYNHSYQPNARYNDVAGNVKVFTALQDILPDTEITINYNGDPHATQDVGFQVL